MMYNPHFGFMDFLMIFKKLKILSRYYVYLIFTWKNFMFSAENLLVHVCIQKYLVLD